MALKATIFKAALQVADMDRHYYADHALTIARHPSETDERMMVRCLAFALNAHEALAFGKGISETEEPDLWRKDLTGSIESWIEVGQPDEKRILRACGRSGRVLVYCYGNAAGIWWKQTADKLARARNLSVFRISPATTTALGKLAKRTMQLQCTIQDGEIWIRDETESVEVVLTKLKEPA